MASVNIARLEDEGEEGLSEPAAKTPDEVSEENASAEMIPSKAQLSQKSKHF